MYKVQIKSKEEKLTEKNLIAQIQIYIQKTTRVIMNKISNYKSKK
jgi:hypothetical protein